MPELPEVETIVRSLNCGGRDCFPLPGRTISRALVLWQHSLVDMDSQTFAQKVAGQTIQAVSRRGKYILLHLDCQVMLIHLRMSGDIRVEESQDPSGDAPLQPHDRLVIHFTDGLRCVFNDARKFGRVWLVADAKEVTGGLGMEPLERNFTSAVLFTHLQRTSRRIKPVLLDQAIISGIGNIYADEALHLAGIHPLVEARKINREQAGALRNAIRKVLREGIRRNGASIDWVYRGGDFQNHFRVYQRSGQPCLACGTTVARIVVGQRGTHFCPACQVAP